jgi:hypothetical protein
MLIWISIIIICVLIILFLLYEKNNTYKNNIIGIWSATPNFCKESGISSFMIKFNKDLKSGIVVMVSSDQNNLLCNSAFTVKGWKILTFTNNKEKINFNFEDKSPIPLNCELEIDNKILLLKNKGKLYGEFIKLS